MSSQSDDDDDDDVWGEPFFLVHICIPRFMAYGPPYPSPWADALIDFAADAFGLEWSAVDERTVDERPMADLSFTAQQAPDRTRLVTALQAFVRMNDVPYWCIEVERWWDVGQSERVWRYPVWINWHAEDKE